jgi:ADP-dependent NAD(P)H-hydrate dehydratase
MTRPERAGDGGGRGLGSDGGGRGGGAAEHGPGTAGAVIVTSAVLRGWPLPEPGGGKEGRGRTLIVGGSVRTPGAVLLAAESALRCGAGKLQVATVASLAPHVAVALPEALVLPLPQTPDGDIAAEAADDVLELARDASAVLLGPGMTGIETTCALLEDLLPELSGPLVLDALCLARVTAEPTALHHLDGRAVLTPNRSELALTLGVDDEQVEDDPGGCAAALAQRARAAVAAGGAESWISAVDGRLWRDQSGGVGLGVSGSGDVFAGIVTGLCARGASPEQAAVWAAHLHGRAGDRLAPAVGRVGFLARELPGQVPQVLAEIEV